MSKVSLQFFRNGDQLVAEKDKSWRCLVGDWLVLASGRAAEEE